MAGIKAKAKLKNGVVKAKLMIKNPSMTYDQQKKRLEAEIMQTLSHILVQL